jgi:prevent-host-death family protein
MIEEVPVAEIKAHFSEYVSISHREGIRILITRRGKHVAALVSIHDLNTLEKIDESKGLADIAGKWENFEEVAESITEVYQSRDEDKHRNVPL